MQVKKRRFYLLFFFLLVANVQLLTTAQAESNAGSQAGISFTEKEEAGTDTSTEIDNNFKPTPHPQADGSHVSSSNLLPQTGYDSGMKKIVSFLFILAGTMLYNQNVKQRKIKEGINFLRKLRN